MINCELCGIVCDERSLCIRTIDGVDIYICNCCNSYYTDDDIDDKFSISC